MFNPFDRRSKVAPATYPRLPFHGIRLFQLIASLVVGGIMLYFIWHLTHDDWTTPWTFIWLTAASLFSIAALLFTILLHCCIGLNPRLNIYVNGFLAVLWALSWSLLTWYMSGTLTNSCDIEHWNEDAGIMVCRIYKALFSFTLLGLLSTLAALALDVYVNRQVGGRGIYRLHDLDSKRRPNAVRGPFTDADATLPHGEEDDPRVSEAWEAPRGSMAPYGEQQQQQRERFTDDHDSALALAPARAPASAPARPRNGGYTVPENQFEYDTQYRGRTPDGEKYYDGPAR